MLLRAALLALSVSALSAPAFGDVPVPRLKPPMANHSAILNDADFDLLRRALRAADSGDWTFVREARFNISHPVAQNLLLWRLASSDARAIFSELHMALEALDGWPRQAAIQREAEWKLADAGLGPDLTASWFAQREPLTGEGRIAWGEALIALGRTDEGREQIREAWRTQSLRQTYQSQVLRRHGDFLTAADHAERVDFLLWAGQRSLASALLPQLGAGERRVADARIRLAARGTGVDGAVNAVPPSLQNDPGLVFERTRWRRRGGNADGALQLALELPDAHTNTTALESMWSERKLIILDLMRSNDHDTAYQLAASNGMSAGVAFADAEFLAGWLALVHLNRPEDALAHFNRLEAGVTTPVSLGRAKYWQGRAAEAAGNAVLARDRFMAAAQHATTYYGQLAILALGGAAAELDLPADPVITEADRAAFNNRDQVLALRMLGELNQTFLFRTFAAHLEGRMETPAEQAMLADIALDYLRLRESVRAAKAGRMQGMILAERAYPVIDVPADAPVRADPALTLSVIRQETEFDARAVSGAGARGMMQMMPATARQTARQLGLPYEFEWLTDDPDYNMRLGMAHLQEVVDDYDGSLVMALAAYNAGGGRVRRWVQEYGDPRFGAIDPIDWVESLPFAETRNYVQRVIENLQVYRARRAGHTAVPLAIERDMVGAGAGLRRILPHLSDEQLAEIEAADAAAREELGMAPMPDVDGEDGGT
ncbi:lytic transglycosylase domain-containing protein [Glycocaulis sp.]|uniref:lytic transglycosylase domain-containing protein n=1 Tax=Glycocaulis sp. TaxID=1969725 RepID=UPI003F71A151